MPIWLEGGLVGLALGAFLVGMEYLLIKRAARERAVRLHRKVVETDPGEHNRMRAIIQFSAVLPFAFAAAWWMLWG
jgi:hypothetical protein